jgi:hypothetical protein
MENETQFVNVPLHKGTILRLPVRQYAEALKRGKQYQRAVQQAAREAHLGAQQEAARLEWITEE